MTTQETGTREATHHFSLNFLGRRKRERQAAEQLKSEQERQAVADALKTVIDGYVETRGEPRTGREFFEDFSGPVEDTNVSVSGHKSIEGNLTTRVVEAKLEDGQRLHLLHQQQTGINDKVYFAITPGNYYPRWSATPPSRDFSALVQAIWPSINIDPFLPKPGFRERRAAPARAMRARMRVGRA